MLDALIRLSLKHRPLVLAAALLTLALGVQVGRELPVEVLPDLTKPTVTILTEVPGLAPEEVEALVTQPIESAIQGVGNLDRLRSSSDVGLSLVFAEFDWGTDIFRARQWVQERLQTVMTTLPEQARPGLAPVSSLMGEILLIGLRSTNGAMAPREVRVLADWTVRRRIQSIPGVAEVLTIGGGIQQVQVQPDPNRMAAHGVTFSELETAAQEAARNTTSGYLVQGSQEIMVRNLGMTTDLDELADTVIKSIGDRPILIRDVATVVQDVQPMRGDAGVNGTAGVILSVDKAPGFDTLALTSAIEEALNGLRASLPPGVEAVLLFRQGDFIQHAVGNLKEAIRDGAVLVAIILFLFLLNLRTTVITLMAIPLSFAVTLLVFHLFGISVNSMTLGGLAVAIGMVVDDAIIDVENVFRRLRENASHPQPKPRMEVIAAASGEVRNSILYATILVILVFVPLLGLSGIEGRLFTPIAMATITSMAASFVVSLTVIPVLCSMLLHPKPARAGGASDGLLVRALKKAFGATWLRLALDQPFLLLGLVVIPVAGAVALFPQLGREFLPAFNEGSATISLASAPGTSLNQANEIGEIGVRLLQEIPEVRSIGRRTGRAERDDHVVPVSVNEFDVEFHEAGRPREVVFEEIRERLATIPGTFVAVGQPIGHRLAHMLSGVSARIAIKVFGPDLDELRRIGTQVEAIAQGLPGLTDVALERQIPIPQLRIEVDRDRARAYGIRPGALNEQLSVLLGGRTVATLREGQRTVDLVLRLPEAWRDSPERLMELPIETGVGQRIPLRLVAQVREAKGPNVVHRENAVRRTVVSANTRERDLESLVLQLQESVAERIQLPEGYFVSYEGEFKAQQEASRRIAALSAVVLGVVALLLYGYFRTPVFAAQVLFDIPLALVGGLFLTWFLVQNISIATWVGFIAVAGVAARNSIMLISHYLHLMRHEGVPFGRALVERGTLERLVPVLMTALSAGIALIPLALAAHEPGKEILHPVAVVIVGGLITSTLLGLGVTPAVFHAFGRNAAIAAVRQKAPATGG
jgi:CzcA family heavy metal efflux pump